MPYGFTVLLDKNVLHQDYFAVKANEDSGTALAAFVVMGDFWFFSS